MIRIINFYTPGPYAEEAKELCESAWKLGLNIYAAEYAHLKCWQDAVCFKPQFILLQLESIMRSSGEDGVLWVDADARFRSLPDWSIFETCDFSACHFQWTKGHPIELLTGTLFFRSNAKTLDFLYRWVALTHEWYYHQTPEQMSLLHAYNSQLDTVTSLRFKELPKEMIFIEPEFREMYPNMTPAISHYQASRRLRK